MCRPPFLVSLGVVIPRLMARDKMVSYLSQDVVRLDVGSMALSRRGCANQASVSGGYPIEDLSCRFFIGWLPRFESYCWKTIGKVPCF